MQRAVLVLSLVLGAGLLVTPGQGLSARTKITRPRPHSFVRSSKVVDSGVDARSQAGSSVAKAIVILQTRENRITIFSGEGEFRYTVATENGILLADRLSAAELKGRFPDLYDIVTGTAWAGM